MACQKTYRRTRRGCSAADIVPHLTKKPAPEMTEQASKLPKQSSRLSVFSRALKPKRPKICSQNPPRRMKLTAELQFHHSSCNSTTTLITQKLGPRAPNQSPKNPMLYTTYSDNNAPKHLLTQMRSLPKVRSLHTQKLQSNGYLPTYNLKETTFALRSYQQANSFTHPLIEILQNPHPELDAQEELRSGKEIWHSQQTQEDVQHIRYQPSEYNLTSVTACIYN